jgi:hypothetical protein
VQYDQAYYMADARAYFSGGHFTLTYGLPFSPDPATPRVYFQPLTLLLGIVRYVTDAAPGLIYAAAGLLFGVLCCRVFIELYGEVVGLGDAGRAVGLICFVWGGGLVTVAGIVYAGTIGAPPLEHLLDFDDGFGGWWFLNLGRNLVYPVEAFYHLVFFGGILLVLRRRFVGAILCVFLLAASHPFTGLQLIAVLGVWAVAETLFRSAARPPAWFVEAVAIAGILHIGYYLVFLPYASPEYKVVQQQWTLPWLYHYWNFLASDGMVASLATIALLLAWRKRPGVDWRQRLLLIWFAVSLVLANHDLIMRPVQPLHFTHGYIWSPLFLLGAPALVTVFERALRWRAGLRIIAVALILILFLFDNAIWFGTKIAAAAISGDDRDGITLDAAERGVLGALAAPDLRQYLLVSQDDKIGYLATVYVPLRAWYSHWANTPHAARRRAELKVFFSGGAEPAAWHRRPVVLVMKRDETGGALHRRFMLEGFEDRLADKRFVLMTRRAAPAP